MEIRHPFYDFSESDLAALRQKIQTDDAYKQRYDRIVQEKEALLDEAFLTEEYANSVFDQHGKFYEVARQIGRMNEVLGSAWLIEQDVRCAEKLRALLLHYAEFRCWAGPDNPYQEVPRRSELTTASIAAAAAYAYDILYAFLSPADRRRIGGAIFEKGTTPLFADWVSPETRIHAMDSMGHNWWAVCVAQGASSLLPLCEQVGEERWNALLDAAEDALESFLTYPGCTLFNKPASYDDKGLFYESVSYFSFGTGELLQYLYRAERYRGRREKLRAALPAGLGDAILSFAYPTARDPGVLFANFGDGSADADVYGMLRWYLLLGFDEPAVRAYVARRRPDWSFSDLFHPELHRGGSWADMPRAAFYPDTGYAFLRDGWQNDATLFALRCGYTWNHAHADAGHFLLWNRGEELIPDSGSCDYGSPLYRSYYCKDEGHNVLLIGGQGQNPEDQYRGSKFHGRLFDTFVGRDFVYVGADATGPLAHLCARAYRNFFWIENRVLVIVDDVRCHREDTVQFLLHHAGGWTQKTENGVPCTVVTGEKSSAAIYHVWPEDVRVSEQIGCIAENKDGEKTEAKHLEFSTQTPARSVLMLTALTLNPEENNIAISPLSELDARGVELREADTGVTRRIWFNLQADGRRMHLNSNSTIDGFETDAYIFMRTCADRSPEQDFLVCTSYHRRPGEAGFASFIKKTAVY